MSRNCGAAGLVHFLLFIFLNIPTGALGQSVSEEARRHFDRGVAAVEIAKNPSDYDEAIHEFREATRLVPSWADAWFNLGIVEEKAGKYNDALKSLEQASTYAGFSAYVADIRRIMDRIEYKLERSGKAENLLKAVSGTWSLSGIDRESGERITRVYTFSVNGTRIEYRYRDAFGELVSPVEFDGNRLKFKYLARATFLQEFEVDVKLVSPGVFRGVFNCRTIKKPDYFKGEMRSWSIAVELIKR